jgi:hypothetical protein
MFVSERWFRKMPFDCNLDLAVRRTSYIRLPLIYSRNAHAMTVKVGFGECTIDHLSIASTVGLDPPAAAVLCAGVALQLKPRFQKFSAFEVSIKSS